MTEDFLNQEAWEQIRSMTDPAFLAELIDIYLIDTPQLIEQARAGLAAGDLDGVRRAAHTIKSNSLTFGANQLAEACRALEMIAKSGTLEGAPKCLADIEDAFTRLAPLLVERKNEH